VLGLATSARGWHPVPLVQASWPHTLAFPVTGESPMASMKAMKARVGNLSLLHGMILLQSGPDLWPSCHESRRRQTLRSPPCISRLPAVGGATQWRVSRRAHLPHPLPLTSASR
jgi:hypothetical protein